MYGHAKPGHHFVNRYKLYNSHSVPLDGPFRARPNTRGKTGFSPFQNNKVYMVEMNLLKIYLPLKIKWHLSWTMGAWWWWWRWYAHGEDGCDGERIMLMVFRTWSVITAFGVTDLPFPLFCISPGPVVLAVAFCLLITCSKCGKTCGRKLCSGRMRPIALGTWAEMWSLDIWDMVELKATFNIDMESFINQLPTVLHLNLI